MENPGCNVFHWNQKMCNIWRKVAELEKDGVPRNQVPEEGFESEEGWHEIDNIFTSLPPNWAFYVKLFLNIHWKIKYYQYKCPYILQIYWKSKWFGFDLTNTWKYVWESNISFLRKDWYSEVAFNTHHQPH